jgi:hypothetical protein
MALGSRMGKQKVQSVVPAVSTVGTSREAAVGPSVGARVSPEISSTVGSSVTVQLVRRTELEFVHRWFDRQ